MSRYLGSTCKKARRYGVDLDMTSGIRALDSKCKLNQLPGVHGDKKGGKRSGYAEQQREKQRARYAYGLTERQFRKFYAEAERRHGPTGTNLVQLLESRLDNVLYRMGFAVTRKEARQIVTHSLVLVNGRPLNIPSAIVRAGDVVSLKEKAQRHTRVLDAMQITGERGLPDWVSVDKDAFQGTFVRMPEREEVLTDLNDNLIVEFYSK